MARAPDIRVQYEPFELTIPRFLKLERVQAAQDRTRIVDRAKTGFLVEEMASSLVASQRHDEPVSIAIEPSGVAFRDLADFIRREELEKLVRIGASLLHDANDVPWRWKTDHLGATMIAVMTFELYGIAAHGAPTYLIDRLASSSNSSQIPA
jgi:hypothetical protein